MPTALPITGRPIRVAVVGLGQISELCLPPYASSAAVEVIGLCDLRRERLERWSVLFPAARATTSLDELLDLGADVVDVLVPTPAHCDVVCRVLGAGHHVQVQKPLARSLDEADRMIQAAAAAGASLRVLEDYVHYPPLRQLADVLATGAVGEPRAAHLKVVATARGGWEVDTASYEWLFAQAADGLGHLTFDHAWHQLALATWLFGPVRRIFGWISETEIVPEVSMDAPATMLWEHRNGVRVTLDVVLAEEMFFRSDYYADDERVEVTGSRGYVRCNRISGRGVQEPSVVVYCEGEVRSFHALADEPPDAFAAMTSAGIDFYRGRSDELHLTAVDARNVLATLLAGIESSHLGRPVDL